MPSTCERWRRDLARHFELRLEPARETALREHLLACAACRHLYERHALLAELDPAAPSRMTRLGRRLGLDTARIPRWRWAAPLAFATAALLLLVMRPGLLIRPELAPQFRARGGAPPATTPAALSALLVQTVGPDGRGRPITDRVRADDEWLFAYRNDEAYRYLLIFGVDETQTVYWYAPAWTDAAADPTALAIEPQHRWVELGDAVRQAIGGSQLTLYAVFTNSPLTVREVERRLSGRDFSLPGARVQRRELTVSH